jgi:hypothetical protein
MRIRIQVFIEADHEATATCVEEVACFERGSLSPETLGLQLDEAKQLLADIQQIMTAQQVEEYVEQQRQCSHCQQPLACKGHHQIGLRTLFGKLTLSSPRCKIRVGDDNRELHPLLYLCLSTSPEAQLESCRRPVL